MEDNLKVNNNWRGEIIANRTCLDEEIHSEAGQVLENKVSYS